MGSIPIPPTINLLIFRRILANGLAVPQMSAVCPHANDQPDHDNARREACMAAERHEAETPAETGNKNSERGQQSHGAYNTQEARRGRTEDLAEQIALLAGHGGRQRGKAG
jgi:hypothetical protein